MRFLWRPLETCENKLFEDFTRILSSLYHVETNIKDQLDKYICLLAGFYKQNSGSKSWNLGKLVPCKTVRKSNKLVLYYNNCSATHRLILYGDKEAKLGLAEVDSHQIKSKYKRLPSPTCEICNKILEINSKRLRFIHCKKLIHMQFSKLICNHQAQQ